MMRFSCAGVNARHPRTKTARPPPPFFEKSFIICGSMKTRQFLSRALLAILLLVSQQTAFAHAASHLADHREASEKQLKADSFCGDCLASAQLDGTAASSLLAPAVPSLPESAALSAAPFALFGSPAAFFQSRAPPAV
jgi:hypothetical protein